MEKEKDYTYMGKDYCPTCNYTIDCASAVEGNHIPMPHDFSVCLNCGEWLEFSDDMALIIMPIKTKNDLSKENLKQLTLATKYIKERGLINK